MILNNETKILIVGLGVIGGGYAKALSKKGYKVKCLTRKQSDIDYALEHNMVIGGSPFPDPILIGEADLIVVALYPGAFIEWVRDNQKHMKSGALLTDVTGVKSSVVYEVQSFLRDDIEFISAHPMAGRERSGIEYSDDMVFRGANFIVTPTESNTSTAIEFCEKLGSELGFAKISRLSPREHDEMIAFLSQLTHVIAVTLMTSNTKDGLEKYTGDSFRDLTRIAKINDKMWSELFLCNKEALLSQMDAFASEFKRFRDMLANGDCEGMREKMRLSTERRGLFDKPVPKQ
ncbi:MAG: prephenate dehydrogenase [Clostridia bacterium]|nr:prephenate dehydrogenase [Clostridia bacterium]